MRTINAMNRRIPEPVVTTLIALALANLAVLGPLTVYAFLGGGR